MGWKGLLATLMVASVAACGASEPSGSTPSPSPSTLSDARVNPENQEVQDTGCDVPAGTVQETTNRLGAYEAKLEVRHSENGEERCKGLHWLRLTPKELPPSPKDKEFAAVLRVGEAEGSERLPDVARQDARPSNPKVELITKGKVVRSGQMIQGCLVLLVDGRPSQGFTCTVPYIVP